MLDSEMLLEIRMDIGRDQVYAEGRHEALHLHDGVERLFSPRPFSGSPNDALHFIAESALIVKEGCPEPWRSTLIEWAGAANAALAQPRSTL